MFTRVNGVCVRVCVCGRGGEKHNREGEGKRSLLPSDFPATWVNLLTSWIFQALLGFAPKSLLFLYFKASVCRNIVSNPCRISHFSTWLDSQSRPHYTWVRLQRFSVITAAFHLSLSNYVAKQDAACVKSCVTGCLRQPHKCVMSTYNNFEHNKKLHRPSSSSFPYSFSLFRRRHSESPFSILTYSLYLLLPACPLRP